MVRKSVVCKGKVYRSGDVMDIWWYTNGYKNVNKHTGIFIDCDEENDKYRFSVDGMTYCFNKVCFYRTIRNETVQESNARNNERSSTFKDELNIDGLFISWMWYIFIMVVAVIFKDCIGIWILASIVFFNYRNKKLKERGHK